MSVYLTGFTAFGDLERNPTEEIIAHYQSQTSQASCLVKDASLLDVSIAAVNAYCERQVKLREDYRKRTETGAVSSLFLHLGVNQRAVGLAIESRAFNNLTFRIPDNDGNQPLAQCMDASLPLDAARFTSFPIQEVISRLNRRQKRHQLRGALCCGGNDDVAVSTRPAVVESSDPGRYICNYLYYSSLQTCANITSSSACDVVFIHTPPLAVCAVDDQIAFVEDVIEIWSGFAK